MTETTQETTRIDFTTDVFFTLVVIVGVIVSKYFEILYGGSIAPRPPTDELQWVWYSFDGYLAFPLGTRMMGLSLLGFILPAILWTTFLIYTKLKMKIKFGWSYGAMFIGTLFICSYAMKRTSTGTVYMLPIGYTLLLFLGSLVAVFGKWPRQGLFAFLHMTALWYGLAFWDIVISTQSSGCIGGGNNGLGDGLWVTPFFVSLYMLIFSVIARYTIHSSNDIQEAGQE